MTDQYDMNPTVMLPPKPDRRWTIAKQLNLNTAVIRFWGIDDWWEYDTLQRTVTRFADHGFSLGVVEDLPPMEKTVLGKEGRDGEIETVKTLIENMAQLGIDTYCWVWTENPLGVICTSDSLPGRGDSQRIGYDHEWTERAPDHEAAGITEEELWENLEYFLERSSPSRRSTESSSRSTRTTRPPRRCAAFRGSCSRTTTTAGSSTSTIASATASRSARETSRRWRGIRSKRFASSATGSTSSTSATSRATSEILWRRGTTRGPPT